MHGLWVVLTVLLIWGLSTTAYAWPLHSVPFALTEQESHYFTDLGTLRVLTLPSWQPFCSQDEGTSMEILQILCEATGVELQAVEARDYADAQTRLEQGEADLCAVTIRPNKGDTPQRLVPYLKAPVLLVSREGELLSEQTDFTIALLSGAVFSDVSYYPAAKERSFDSVTSCLNSVRSHQSDFFLCDPYTLSPFSSRLNAMNLIARNLPQHDVQIGFGLPQNADKLLVSVLEKAAASVTTPKLSESLIRNAEQTDSQNKFVNFVYRNPFELLCAFASIFFVMLVIVLVYARVRTGQQQELHGYEESYRMLADTFGEAGMEYDFLQDRLTLFGKQHSRLDLPESVERFHTALANKALRISLTPEAFDELLQKNEPGRSYEAELRCGMQEGGWNWFRMIFIVVCTSESHQRPIRLIGCLVNHEAEHQEKERLFLMGHNDPLTGLLNRRATEEKLKNVLKDVCRTSVLMVLDIDHFKRINDENGHLCGDEALAAMGDAIRKTFPQNSFLCRWGGDEFLIFLTGAGEHIAEVETQLHRLRAEMKAFTFQGSPLPIDLSIGGVITAPNVSFEALFKQADETLYSVKNSGRDHYLLLPVTLCENEMGVVADEADS